MKHHTPAVTHPAHDRLLQLKLQGANHLARVLDSDAPEPTKLKAAMALARLAIPAATAAAASPPLPLPAGEGWGEGVPATDPQTSAGATNTQVAPPATPKPTDSPAVNATARTTATRPRTAAPTLSPTLAAKHTLLQRNLARLPGAAARHRPRIEAHAALSP